MRRPQGVLKDLADYYTAFGNQLAKNLKERGVKKGTTLQLIFSRTSFFKCYYISKSLRRAGCGIATPGS